MEGGQAFLLLQRPDHPHKQMNIAVETPQQRYYRLNKAKINERSKQWRIKNPERAKEISKLSQSRWRKERLQKKKQDRQNNPEKYRILDKKAYARIREKHLIKLREFNATPEGKMMTLLRNTCRRIAKLNKTLSRPKADLLGASIETVRRHIESQFLPGMGWHNHGIHGWHIDHKRPLASFDLTDPNQLREAAHYTNLSPLWAYDNWSKGAKVI